MGDIEEMPKKKKIKPGVWWGASTSERGQIGVMMMSEGWGKPGGASLVSQKAETFCWSGSKHSVTGVVCRREDMMEKSQENSVYEGRQNRMKTRRLRATALGRRRREKKLLFGS